MKFNLNNMFGNKSTKPKDNSYSEPTYREEIKPPVRSTATNQDRVLTLISEGCKFEGNLSSPSTTKIDGHIVGNLRGESGIVIGEKGIVEGNVNAVDVTIYGTVKGNVKAHKLELKRSGSLDGDIIIEELVTESGSRFNGSSKMGDKSKSNIIDMKVDMKETETDIEIRPEEEKPKDKPVLKFH
ncbi:MAG: polymer-forming cytoskeletal protein [Ignavibacteria bacterium]|nr:polymer-forming cytoskeletal protein [Ignavibacteriota bacterium]